MKKKKELKHRVDENTETQMVKEGQSRRKGYTGCTVLHAMTVSAVLCMSQKLQFSSPFKVFSPFTVWLVRAAVAVGTKFKKAA